MGLQARPISDMEFSSYLNSLRDESTQLTVADLQQLDALAPEQAEEFRSAWPEIGPERRRYVIRQLVELVENNVDLNFDTVFFSALNDEDAEVRSSAIGGLWEYEGHNLIAPLLRLLERDEEPEVRMEAALALGRFVLRFELGKLREHHFEQVERGLRRTLEDEVEVDEVRARALEALGALSRPWVSDAIQRAYEGESPRLKVSALHAMGRSCEPRWLPSLAEELANDDPEVRYEAATALGSIGERSAVSHLAPLLHDADSEVKEATIAALGQIGSPQAKALLRSLLDTPSPSVQEAAAAAVAEAEFAEDPFTVEYKL